MIPAKDTMLVVQSSARALSDADASLATAAAAAAMLPSWLRQLAHTLYCRA